MTIRILPLALLVLLTGCSSVSPYVYRPETRATATIDRHPAADYEIPQESPRGDVRIASLGVADVKAGEKAETAPAMVVRMILANTSDDAIWSLDTRAVCAELPDQGSRRPEYVGTEVASDMPFVRVPKGERRVVDLYYPLPEGMEAEKKLPAFEVTWAIQTGARLVAERTPFARMRIPAPPSSSFGFGSDYDTLTN